MCTSEPEGPGARLGRRPHWPLASCQGPLQVGSDLGHDLLGAANRRRPAAFAAGTALAAPGWGRGPHGDLVPGDLLVDGDSHGYLGSVGDGRTYPPRAAVDQITHSGSWHMARRSGLGYAKARACADRNAPLARWFGC